MLKIGIQDAHFYAFHGYFAAERHIGCWYRVSCSVTTDQIQVTESQDPRHIINYQILFEVLKEKMLTPVLFLEQIAAGVIIELKSRELPKSKLNLKIEKLKPLVMGPMDSAFVEIIDYDL